MAMFSKQIIPAMFGKRTDTITIQIDLILQKKIEHIHECVVNGDLEELQSALTRRKMALSRDDQERNTAIHEIVT